ncbi:MAG: hypothetical protein ACODAA_08810, partial [Gemmatimonadota bacterium]
MIQAFPRPRSRRGFTTRSRAFALALVAGLAAVGPVAAQDAPTGNYEGTLTIGEGEIPFTLTVRAGDDGLEGYFSMPAQGMLNTPVSAFSFEDGTFDFDLDVGGREPAAFRGTRDGDDVHGTTTGPELPEGVTWTATRTGDAELAAVPTLAVEPKVVELTAGESTRLEVVARDSDGNVVEPEAVRFFVRGGQGLLVHDDGRIETSAGGDYTIYAFARVGETNLRENVEASVSWPPVEEIRIADLPDELQEGNAYRVEPVVVTEGGLTR